MAQKITTNEIKFTDNELWRAMEMQVMDLVSDLFFIGDYCVQICP